MDAPKTERSRLPTVSRVLPDGRIIELVREADEPRATKLAVHFENVTTLVDELAINDGKTLVPVPASNNLIRHDAVVLPGPPSEYGSVQDLVAQIEAYLDHYVIVSVSFRHIAAYYILFSWVYDAFEELPYLRVQADFGSGKTRALIVIGSLCYRAFLASGASTVSPIFHTLDLFRGTLVLDEADFRFSDTTAELTKILNNGNVRGFPVFRTQFTAKREFDPRAFQVFGPKLIAMRKSFDDDALESRFITERMQSIRNRPDIPLNLPPAQRIEAQALRCKLLQYRFDHRLKVAADPSLADPSLSPRSNQILIPLLSIVPDAQTRADMRSAMKCLEAEQRQDRSTSIEAELLEVLHEARGDSPDAPIPVGLITRQFTERCAGDTDRPITARYVGSLLRSRLGLATFKRNGVYMVAASGDRIAALKSRYGLQTAASPNQP